MTVRRRVLALPALPGVRVETPLRVTFGMFLGRPWDQVPEEYLRFLCSSECTAASERKRFARIELFRRWMGEDAPKTAGPRAALFVDLPQRTPSL